MKTNIITKDSLNSIVLQTIDFAEFLLKKDHQIELTTEQEDAIFDGLILMFDDIFPEADYQNYN